MKYIGNSKIEDFEKIHSKRGLIKGDPVATDKYTAEQLKEMGFVGIYNQELFNPQQV